MPSLSKLIPMALSCLLLTICLAASAKADQIVNLVFTGTATCEDSFCSSFGSGPLTGTYSLDVTTQTIVGAWSFSTPFGVISSSAAGANAVILDFSGDIQPDFLESTSTFFEFVHFFFPGTDTEEIGALATNVPSGACLNEIKGQASCDPDYIVTGATARTVPEPSSLMLLGLGMLGLVGISLKKSFLS